MPCNCHRPAACASPVTAPLWLARRAGENTTRHFVSAKTVCALLERHLGVSRAHKRRNLQVRAAAILTTELAYMPSLLPPPELPLTQYFGGQAIMVNAGTLKALERKGAAKKPTRPTVPQNSATSAKKTMDDGTHYSGPFLS